MYIKITQNTTLKNCCAKYIVSGNLLRKIQTFHCLPKKMFRKTQLRLFICLRKLQLSQKNVPQNTKIKNGYSANYSFLKKFLRILLFPQNTKIN